MARIHNGLFGQILFVQTQSQDTVHHTVTISHDPNPLSDQPPQRLIINHPFDMPLTKMLNMPDSMPKYTSSKGLLTAAAVGIIGLSFATQLCDTSLCSLLHKAAAALLLIKGTNTVDQLNADLDDSRELLDYDGAQMKQMRRKLQAAESQLECSNTDKEYESALEHYKQSTKRLLVENKKLKEQRKIEFAVHKSLQQEHYNTVERLRITECKLVAAEEANTSLRKDQHGERTKLKEENFFVKNNRSEEGRELTKDLEVVQSEIEAHKTFNNELSSELATANSKAAAAGQTIVSQLQTINSQKTSLKSCLLDLMHKGQNLAAKEEELAEQAQILQVAQAEIATRDETIASMAHSYQLQVRMTKALDTKNKDLETKVATTETQIVTAQEQLKTTTAKVDGLERSQRRLRADLSDAQTLSEHQDDLIVSLEEKVKELSATPPPSPDADIASLRSRIEQYEAVIETQNEQASEDAAAIASLEGGKEMNDQLIHLLRIDIDAVNKRNVLLSDTLTAKEEEIAAVKNGRKTEDAATISHLAAGKEAAEKHANMLKEEVEVLERDIDAAKMTAREMETRAKAAEEQLVARNLDVEVTVAKLEADRTEVEDKLSNLRGEIEVLQLEIENNDQAKPSTSETHMAEESACNCSDEIKDLTAEVKELKVLVESSGDQLIETEAVSLAKIQSLEEANEKLQKGTDSILADRKYCMSEATRLQQQVDASFVQGLDFSGDMGAGGDDQAVKIQLLEDQVTDYQDRVRRLRNEASAAGAESLKAKAEKSELQRELETLRRELQCSKGVAHGDNDHVDDYPSEYDTSNWVHGYRFDDFSDRDSLPHIDSGFHSRQISSQMSLDPDEAVKPAPPEEVATTNGFTQPVAPQSTMQGAKKRHVRVRTNYKFCAKDLNCTKADCKFKHHNSSGYRGKVDLDTMCELGVECGMYSCRGWHPSPALRT